MLLYVAENKTLAGKEDRAYEGEAIGRKLAATFFVEAPLRRAHRLNKDQEAMKPELLTIAEILQAAGFAVPPDPERTAAATELLLEAQYEDLEILRYSCALDEDADEVHVYRLSDEVNAEAALACELPAAQRTKMVLARSLQRGEAFGAGETLERVWSLPHAALQQRAAHLFPGPPLPLPPAPPAAPLAPAAAPRAGGRRGRGRGKGRRRGR